ncbi:MAG: type II toxin-antitoxin system RelE/ParE family toxin [Betaproteobacteria bacterium]|nr:type II toxin-antitoxin system RelE/ParE family toxin [Betaproteobacteria bacterium]
MTYELAFKASALKEWARLDATVRGQFKKKLAERLENPRVESARLSLLKDCYKIKLTGLGYRLVYQVEDNIVTVTVIAVGKRERGAVYRKAHERL